MINYNDNIMYVKFESDLNNKDFKFELGDNGFIKEIDVNIFGKTCYLIYNISKSSMKICMN